MKSVHFDKKKLIPVAVVSLFFFTYVLLGCLIYKDYGVSADETIDFRRGQVNYNRLMGGSLADFMDQCSQSKTICYYPPAFSMLLYAIAPGGDTQSIYLRRHLLTFAFFAFSVFIFFLIGKKIFKDWKIGLLGALFLIISPRIFAHSFYNPKDLPFLSVYVISIYTLLLFLEKKNIYHRHPAWRDDWVSVQHPHSGINHYSNLHRFLSLRSPFIQGQIGRVISKPAHSCLFLS